MCGSGNNQFDADLLRIRKVRVTLRMQAASAVASRHGHDAVQEPGHVAGRRPVRARLHGLVRSRAAQPEPDTVRTHAHPRFHARLAERSGAALIIALMAMMLLTALGAAVVMVSNTETHIAGNYRNSQEALYAADAAVERVVQDLLLIPRWNDILGGTAQSGFVDGGDDRVQDAARRRHDDALLRHEYGDRAAPGGDRRAQPVGHQQSRSGSCLPGARSATCCRNDQIDSPMYVAVWVADDPGGNGRQPG